MGECTMCRWLGGTVLGGIALVAVTLAAVDGRSAWAASDLPEVEAPDFAEAGEVIDSLETMMDAIEEVKEAEGWRALRAIDQCDTAIDIIEDKVTAAAYDAEAGERSWQLCHHRYQVLKLH
ncbi:hypothetical protein [Algihabitans albus]|uniref:hypothetical protein n=1 Tax=Algihabitans albus TaxID=2164067 RepID=UPI0013C2CF93|nr:hypothetical protein [Algihabitans albus]